MKKILRKPPVLGSFLKELREKKGVSLLDVEHALKIPNAYISQLETGARKKLPEPDRLRLLADYYNVTTQELLAKAGYYEEKNVIQESFSNQINKAFLHVIYNPQFKTGQHINPDTIPLDIKRFVVEMFAYNVKKSSFDIRPQAAGTVIEKNIVRSLRWKTKNVIRDTFKREKETIIRYRVQIVCTETTGQYDHEKVYFDGAKQGTEKVTQIADGEGVCEESENNWQGYESMLLARATETAVRNALPKFKSTNWSAIVKPMIE